MAKPPPPLPIATISMVFVSLLIVAIVASLWMVAIGLLVLFVAGLLFWLAIQLPLFLLLDRVLPGILARHDLEPLRIPGLLLAVAGLLLAGFHVWGLAEAGRLAGLGDLMNLFGPDARSGGGARLGVWIAVIGLGLHTVPISQRRALAIGRSLARRRRITGR